MTSAGVRQLVSQLKRPCLRLRTAWSCPGQPWQPRRCRRQSPPAFDRCPRRGGGFAEAVRPPVRPLRDAEPLPDCWQPLPERRYHRRRPPQSKPTGASDSAPESRMAGEGREHLPSWPTCRHPARIVLERRQIAAWWVWLLSTGTAAPSEANDRLRRTRTGPRLCIWGALTASRFNLVRYGDFYQRLLARW